MVRLLRDAELRDRIDLPRVVARLEAGYLADAEGGVTAFPRSRYDAGGTTFAWLGAAVRSQDLLGFRSYLYRPDGYDRGEQLVALYGLTRMELRAVFVGRLVGNLRTGATVAAAFHLLDPALREIGIVGTGYQARNATTCLAAVFPIARFVVWSPTPAHREEFRSWSRASLRADVTVVDRPDEMFRTVGALALLTSATEPVISAAEIPGRAIVVSLSGYRRREIAPEMLDATPRIWTDSVAQASGPGTLFESSERRAKLRPLGRGLADGTARDPRSVTIVLNTGAAWEEAVTAQALYELALAQGIGTEIELPTAGAGSDTF